MSALREMLEVLAEQHAKIQELEQWKKEALVVMNRFDKTRVAEALGFTAGMDMDTGNFLRQIKKLKEESEFRAGTIEEQRKFIGKLKDDLCRTTDENIALKKELYRARGFV